MLLLLLLLLLLFQHIIIIVLAHRVPILDAVQVADNNIYEGLLIDHILIQIEVPSVVEELLDQLLGYVEYLNGLGNGMN